MGDVRDRTAETSSSSRSTGALGSLSACPTTISSVFDALDDGTIIVDPDDTVAWANETAPEHLGRPPEEIVDRNRTALLEETVGQRVTDCTSVVKRRGYLLA